MKRIRHILTPVITVLMWILAIVIATLTINFVFGKDENVTVIAIASTILMTLTTILWSPTGIEIGEKVAKVHNNTEIYMNRANYIVNNQMFDKTKEFCHYRNEVYRKELITAKLSKVYIGYDDWVAWDKAYKKSIAAKCTQKDKDDFNTLCSKYTEKELKVMTRLSTKGVSFSLLTPDDLTKYHDTKNRLKPKNFEKIGRNVRLIVKIIWGIMLGLGTVGLIVSANGFGFEQILQILTFTISILFNIYSSITNSYRSVTVYRNNYLVEKNDRCAEFFAYCGIKTDDIDAMVAHKLIEDKDANKNS